MTSDSLWQFLSDRAPELGQRTAEHLMLTCVSTVLAAVIGIAIAVVAHKSSTLRGPVLACVGILQTIPSLAMLVLLMTLMGRIGVAPALVALTLYALLPIVRNTLLGLESTPRALIESATGLGMTSTQELFLVRIPLAMPAIMAGLRTATVVGVGIATLAAFIGAGGLGEFINRGLALSNSQLIFLGAIPAGILAILADMSLAAAEWGVRPIRASASSAPIGTQKMRRRLAASLPAFLLVFSVVFYCQQHPIIKGNIVRIGCKHDTEQIIVAEMLAQLLEQRTTLKVQRRLDLGGTLVCHGAIIRDEIDMYPECTGTGLASILHIERVRDPKVAFNLVSTEYEKRFHLKWLQPLGFNDSWAILATKAAADKHRWRSISDLQNFAPALRIGVISEFAERQDGYPGLCKTYKLKFRQEEDLANSIVCQALANGQVDIASGNTVDGRIEAYNLVVLDDDRSFFLPYQVAIVLRDDFCQQHPEAVEALNTLCGAIDDRTMRKLNYEVDGKHHNPSDVVREFLTEHETQAKEGNSTGTIPSPESIQVNR